MVTLVWIRISSTRGRTASRRDARNERFGSRTMGSRTMISHHSRVIIVIGLVVMSTFNNCRQRTPSIVVVSSRASLTHGAVHSAQALYDQDNRRASESCEYQDLSLEENLPGFARSGLSPDLSVQESHHCAILAERTIGSQIRHNRISTR